MKSNKLRIALILAFSFVLFSSTAYAKSFTDVLGDSFLLINDFFKNDGYKPYSLIIDFFVFSVVFMAIYMRGVKFAFKEVSKTEKALAVILGLTTAFLMILGDYSISKLLPLLNWLLYFLLFAFVWWLLKGMKSKGWRFLLALLLTLLLILLFLSLSSGLFLTSLKCPGQMLPLLNLLFAILMFIVFWFLLKDIKNSFGRFLLALLLTAIIVLIILALLKYAIKDASCPESPFSTTLFGDIGRSFGSVDFSTPEFFRSLTTGSSAPALQQIDAPSTTVPGAGLAPQADPLKKISNEQLNRMLQDSRATTSAKQRIQNELDLRQSSVPRGLEPEPPTGPGRPKRISLDGTSNNEGYYFASAGGILSILLLIWKVWGKKKFKEWRKKNDKETNVLEILERIKIVTEAKNKYIENLKKLQRLRNQIMHAEDVRTVFIKKINDKNEQAYLLEEPKQEMFTQMEKWVDALGTTEHLLIHTTRNIAEIEDDFLDRLEAWDDILRKDNINAKEELGALETIIGTGGGGGVINTILDLFHISSDDLKLEGGLKRLLKNKVKLVTKRIDRFVKEEHRLSELFGEDDKKISHLLQVLNYQLDYLERLKQKIEAKQQTVAAKQPKVGIGAGGIRINLAPPEPINPKDLPKIGEIIVEVLAGNKWTTKLPLDEGVPIIYSHQDFQFLVPLIQGKPPITARILVNGTEAYRYEYTSRTGAIGVVDKMLSKALAFDSNELKDEQRQLKNFKVGANDIAIEVLKSDGKNLVLGDRKEIKVILSNENAPLKPEGRITKIVSKHRRKIMVGAGVTAIVGAAGLGALSYLESQRTPPSPPPTPPPIVRPAQQERKVMVTYAKETNEGKIRTIFLIQDGNKNARYSVAAYLEYPQASGKWKKIDVTFHGRVPYETYTIDFDARNFPHAYVNLRLAAVTEGSKTIYSEDEEVKLGQ